MAGEKIVFLDVDGTIVTYENVLPASAARAIREARAAGHKVLMCTGRSKGEVQPELAALGFDGMIGGNGAYVEVDGRAVMHRLVTPEQCRRIVDWCHARDLPFYLESNNGLFASEGFREAALFGDFGVLGIDKAAAVRAAVEALGADMGETIAVGDARVDIPMLETCAVGVAMGSGGPEIRAMADYVTGDVDKDGLWQAFCHLGLV